MIRSALLTLAVSVISAATARAQTTCAAMSGFTAPDVKITAAAPLPDPVPLCKVEGVIAPRSGSPSGCRTPGTGSS